MSSFSDSNIMCHHTIDHNPNPNKFPMHAHYTNEIYFFISGKGVYYVEGNSYTLQQNDVLIMRQGETHKLHIDKSQSYERIAIHFSPAIFKNYPDYILKPFNDRPLGRLNQLHTSSFATDHYISTFNLIRNAIESKNPSFHLTAHLFSLVSEIYLAYEKQLKIEQQPDSNYLIVNIVDFINNNLYADISLDALSERFYLSKSQINRLFKKATGTTVWNYILIKRLMKAKSFIEHGETALAASNKCGFRDYSTFYRAYKSRFGCSPKSNINLS